MKIIELKCPSCNATLDIESGRETVFCTYCGSKVMVDDGTKRVEVTKNINTTYKKVDQARIYESETDRLIKFKEMETAEKKRKTIMLTSLVLAIIWVVSLVVLLIVSVNTAHKNTGFSPYQLLLLVDLFVGPALIRGVTKFIKKW